MFIFNNKIKNKGFTLVELLVVIAIIGTLATLLLLQLGIARAKARDTKRIADINQLRTAVELYFDDNGSYPTALSIANLGKYLTLSTIPTDPLISTVAYKYAWSPLASPLKFHIWTNLEQNNSAALHGDGDINSSGWLNGNVFDGTGGGVTPNPTEACTSAGSGPSAATPNCVYDVGQN